MRYLGSKASTLSDLRSIVESRYDGGVLCDCFAGIGTVGASFKSEGFSVWTADILRFAHYFQVAKIQLSSPPRFLALAEDTGLAGPTDVQLHLDRLEPHGGWFVNEYANIRQFFTLENASRINACLTEISEWARRRLLSYEEHALLVASLISSMDRVANTAGTYYAHLKRWDRKAKQSFRYRLIVPTSGLESTAFLGDARDLVAARDFDVLYLDPPYNARNYARYYHLPETIAIGDQPEVTGAAGMPRRDHASSDFTSPARVEQAMDDLLSRAKFRCLIFHYADTGLLSPTWIRSRLQQFGFVEEHILTSRGYTTNARPRATSHRLYVVDRT